MHDLVDIGANLTHDSFDHDRAEVLARAAAAGVRRAIVTGASVTGSAQAIELAAEHPGILYATAGVHPHHAAEYDEHTSAALAALLSDPRVVAVGECGLDYFRDFAPRDAQLRAFRAQLELAVAAGKPVFLHERDAHADFLATLAPLARDLTRGGVAHCFTGGPAGLDAYLELGLHIGVTGWVCDERRGAELRAAVPSIPLERLLLETDAPYLLPRDLAPRPKHRRNEPAFLPHVLARVAALMERTEDEVARAATANAQKLFRLR
jgi:TatD DNase family protein